MYRQIFIVVLVLSFWLGLTSCEDSGRSSNINRNPVVVGKAESVLKALMSRDFETAMKQYPDSFFNRMDREDWRQQLESYDNDRGPMLSYRLVKSQADTRFSGKFFILEYTVIHEGNKRANHLITFLSPVEGGEIKIIGHKITPWQEESGAGN